jgi:hypothetical protein
LRPWIDEVLKGRHPSPTSRTYAWLIHEVSPSE